MDYLMRADAPLSEPEWAALDQMVVNVARRLVVGRRLLPLFGPLGPGLEVIPVNQVYGLSAGQVDMTGSQDDAVAVDARLYLRLPMLHKDFVLYWRDLEQGRRLGIPQDFSQAAAAAAFVAESEDHLVFHGDETDKVPGLLTVPGRHTLPVSDWSVPGSGFDDTVRALSHLTAAGFYPPYAVVVGPVGYARWHRLYGASGVLEVEQIRKLSEAGVFVSPLMPADTMLVTAVGEENADLAVGVDLSVAFLETAQMNHHFRTFEILVPRVKRPGAICVLEPPEG